MNGVHLTAYERLQRVRSPRSVSPAEPPAMHAPRADRAGKAAIWLLGIYLIGKMFYVLGGGSAQPADLMVFALAFFVITPTSFGRFLRDEVALTILVTWIMLVNIAWFLTTAETNFLPAVLYYLFNIIIVAATFSARLRQPQLFDVLLPRFIMVAIGLQTAVVLVGLVASGGSMRSEGTFTNPNQLAYWGIAMLSILLLLRRNKPKLTDLPFIVMVLLCEYASASRAGLISTIILVLMWLFFALGTPLKRAIGLTLAVLLAFASMTSSNVARFADYEAQDTSAARNFKATNSAAQIEERNYDRILDYYEYTAFGAGEGDLDRFQIDDEIVLEIHSTFGTLLFSYGIPGFVLFLAFIASLFLRLPVAHAMYLVPSLSYGVTHQGLRFTFFWVLVGILCCMARERKIAREENATPPAPRGRVRRDAAFLRSLGRDG